MDEKAMIEAREYRYYPSDRSDYRTAYERDYGRIIHSPAFRRLQGKSQVFGAGSGDYYRTRLTHTLEVAQIARHIARHLSEEYNLKSVDHPGLVIDPQVVECAALAHDLGHPPFGHTGERVLDALLPSSDRFEGNAQNFRIAMFLEKRTEVCGATAKPIDGLNLTAAVLLATNKYPYRIARRDETIPEGNTETHQKKGLYETEWPQISDIRARWGLKPGWQTLEAQVMDLADDIAYSTHDLEDGIRAGKVHLDTLCPTHREFKVLQQGVVRELRKDAKNGDHIWTPDINIEATVESVLGFYYEEWQRILGISGDVSRARREMTSYWVGRFASSVGVIDRDGWKKVTFVLDRRENTALRRELAILKRLAWVLMVRDFRVQRMERRSEYVLKRLWEILSDEDTGSKVIPSDWVQRYHDNKQRWTWQRLAADYLAGCTDAYAERLYGELFAGTPYGSIYEKD